jgi:hypothetical protein
LARIAPLSDGFAAGSRRKAAGLRKLRRLCEADKLRKGFALPTVKFYVSQYRNALRAMTLLFRRSSLASTKKKQRFSYLALTRAETAQINAAYQTQIPR